MFISPGLYRTEKKYFLPIVVFSVVFFFLGSAFGYFVAFLTPGPDVIRQLIMAGPLMILYEIGIIGARIFGKKPDTDTDNASDPKGDNDTDEFDRNNEHP